MNGEKLEGILLVNKPRGITSHDVIGKLRRILGMKRIGHAGTLDPMCTGLLLILIGQATKMSQHLSGLAKSYAGTMTLGTATDSFDSEGTVTKVGSFENVTIDGLRSLAEEFMGNQYQIPPMFSAKKINGQKLYKLARKGESVERQPQSIRIDAFDIHNFRGSEVDFFVSCSKGTYVRALVHDFGERLACCAHLSSLCRTAIEGFSLENSLSLEAIEEMTPVELEKKMISPRVAIEQLTR